MFTRWLKQLKIRRGGDQLFRLSLGVGIDLTAQGDKVIFQNISNLYLKISVNIYFKIGYRYFTFKIIGNVYSIFL